MSKKAISVTLEKSNLLWLRSQVAHRGARSISEVLDQILVATRSSSEDPSAVRSVKGTVEIDEASLDLSLATSVLRGEFEASLARPLRARTRRGSRA